MLKERFQMVRMGMATHLLEGIRQNPQPPSLSYKSIKVIRSDEDLLCLVALPFLIFMRRSLLLGIYDARTGLLPDRLTCPYCKWPAFITVISASERLPDALVLSPAYGDSR